MLHHYPICVTYALFDDGKLPVADPTAQEEKISNASIVLAVNSYKELCSMHLTGVCLTSPKVIQECSELAAERARRIVDYIKHVMEEDTKQRDSGVVKGPSEVIKLSKITSNFHEAKKIEAMEESGSEVGSLSSNEEPSNLPINKLDKDTVTTDLKWNTVDESSSSDDEEMAPVSKKDVKKIANENCMDDEEEDETIVLH